jgi:hypothetical protein
MQISQSLSLIHKTSIKCILLHRYSHAGVKHRSRSDLLLAVHAAGVSSVVDRIWYGALDALGEDLLDLLGDNGSLSTVLGVRNVLGSSVGGIGRVNLRLVLEIVT